jgi:hypothetical protein
MHGGWEAPPELEEDLELLGSGVRRTRLVLCLCLAKVEDEACRIPRTMVFCVSGRLFDAIGYVALDLAGRL